MKDQVFELENFRGPMDLLLHLIREQEMEIIEVDLARLCDQYLAAIDVIKALDVNLAGEFLVMASTLMLIKSRTILPREEVDLEEELDPGDELILQLLEYRKYKSLAFELGRRSADRHRRWARGADDVPDAPEPELEELGLWDLVGTYARLVEELGLRRTFHTMDRERPLRDFMKDVVATLLENDACDFRGLVMGAGGKEAVFPVFLSLLELIRTGQVVAKQEEVRGEIVVRLRQDRDQGRLSALFGDDAPVDDAEGEAETGIENVDPPDPRPATLEPARVQAEPRERSEPGPLAGSGEDAIV